jgi:hypothetical protein
MTPIDYNNPNDMWRNNGYDPYKGMSDEERMKAGCIQLAGIVGTIIVALLICALFGSCTTTKYVQVPVVHNDTTIVTKHHRDSIYVEKHDSIVLQTKGDTVTIDRWHFRDRWRDRVMVDTFYQSKTDTVIVVKEAEKAEAVPLWKILWQRKWRLAIIIAIMAVSLWIWKTK